MIAARRLMMTGQRPVYDIYSTSTDGTVRRIDLNGGEVWSYTIPNSAQGRCVAVDQSGNCYVGDSLERITKLNSGGGFVWRKDLSANANEIMRIAVDTSGNVFAATGSSDTVIKLNADGSTIDWTFSGFSGDVDCVVAGGDGNIYAASLTDTVRKINSAGSQVWVFNGEDVADNFKAVDVDVSGNVFANGNNGTFYKLNSSGVKVFKTTPIATDYEAVRSDGDGNIFIGGENDAVVKLNSLGAVIWTSANVGDTVRAIALDDFGNSYAAVRNGTIRKFDSGGGSVWTFSGHASEVTDIASALTLKFAGFSI